MSEDNTTTEAMFSGVVFILSKGAGDFREPRREQLLPITFPQTPAAGVAVTSVFLALAAQGGRAGSEIL